MFGGTIYFITLVCAIAGPGLGWYDPAKVDTFTGGLIVSALLFVGSACVAYVCAPERPLAQLLLALFMTGLGLFFVVTLLAAQMYSVDEPFSVIPGSMSE